MLDEVLIEGDDEGWHLVLSGDFHYPAISAEMVEVAAEALHQTMVGPNEPPRPVGRRSRHRARKMLEAALVADGPLSLRLPDEVADQLLEQVGAIREHVAERERERAAYQAASPEERARVLGRDQEDVDAAELLRERADLSRKAERENRP